MQYDKKELHEAIKILDQALEPTGISKIEAALRWIAFHSQLQTQDGIILGASKPHYVEQNIQAIREGPLPAEIVAAMEKLWGQLTSLR